MDKDFKRHAAEWFERARHDIETAQLIYDQRGHTDSIAYHIQQAIEKSLKGYLVLHGKKPPWIHELDTLLHKAAAIDPTLLDFIDVCEKASRYYFEDRYPPGPAVQYEYDEIKADLDRAWELTRRMQALLGT